MNEKDYGFYFISLWRHWKEYDMPMSFHLFNFSIDRFVENWSIVIILFNFDFGYISKPKKRDK